MAKTRRTGASRPKSLVDSDGTVMIFGVVGDPFDGLGSEEVVSAIRQLSDDVERLHVLINSPGGLVAEGLAIYHELRTNPRPVDVEITGVAASMASVIACAGDTVRIAPNAMVMIHDPWNVAAGNAEELRRAADLLDQWSTSLVDIYVTHTGLSEDEVREMMAAETWMNAETALEKGFVGEIIDIATDPEAFADLDLSDFQAAPAALTQLIRKGRLMARTKKATTSPAGTEPVTPPAEPTPTPAVEPTEPVGAEPRDVTAEIQAALQRQRTRDARIRALHEQHPHVPQAFVNGLLDSEDPIDVVNARFLDELVNHQPDPVRHHSITVGTDERDRFRGAAVDGIIARGGFAQLVSETESREVDGGHFQGRSLLQLAEECLQSVGVNTRSLNRHQIARMALARGPKASSLGLQTTSDFPILLENAIHKLVLAGYNTQPDTWRLFCGVGTVSDFRVHNRYRMGSLSSLEKKNEAGEIRFKALPDGERETIQAEARGNIIGVTRETIVNDDVGLVTRLAEALGRAAQRTIEQTVYDALAENAGRGPTMGDGDALFHANHNNLQTGSGAPSTATVEAARVLLASQQDVSGNDYISLSPYAWVGPMNLGAQARVTNQSQFEIKGAATDPNSPNIANGLFSVIVDTPRLTGTTWRMFANPAIAAAIEVAFLDGVQAPQIMTEEGFDYDGARWRVMLDFGVAGLDYRAAVQVEV